MCIRLIQSGWLATLCLSLACQPSLLAAMQEAPDRSPQAGAELGPQGQEQAPVQNENSAWQQVLQAPSIAEQAALAEQYLKDYPAGQRAVYAHYLISQNLFHLGDAANFIPHAETALAGMEGAVDLLTQLAFFYAETRDSQKAVERASAALMAMEELERPAGVLPEEWVAQIYKWKAEAQYAMGRAYLDMREEGQDPAQDLTLRKAYAYLKSALRYDPRHDFACFRLGFAARNINDAEGALMAYGRAVALNGVAAGPSQVELEEILSLIRAGAPQSEWAQKTVAEVVSAAEAQLDTELARVRSEQAEMVEQLRAQEIPAASAPPGAPADEGSGVPPS